MYPVRQRISFDEYLRIEEESVSKHEYVDGGAWLMPSRSYEESAIASNITAILGSHLRGKGCRPYGSDLRIRVRATGIATYPNLSVIRGRIQLDPADKKKTTALNPCVLVETASSDSRLRLGHFKRIRTLREVMLVSTKDKVVDVWRRTGTSWKRHEYRDVAELQSVGVGLALSEIYRGLAGEEA